MKIGNEPNYIVQVFPDAEGDMSAEVAARHEGMFTIVLNVSVRVHVVPQVGPQPPVWPDLRAVRESEFTTAEEVRWYELLAGTHSITPNEAKAGHVEQLGTFDPPSTVFYVTPDEFALFTRELTDLAEITDGVGSSPRRADVLDRAVMRFVDEVVLNSPHLSPYRAAAVGRPRSDASTA